LTNFEQVQSGDSPQFNIKEFLANYATQFIPNLKVEDFLRT